MEGNPVHLNFIEDMEACITHSGNFIVWIGEDMSLVEAICFNKLIQPFKSSILQFNAAIHQPLLFTLTPENDNLITKTKKSLIKPTSSLRAFESANRPPISRFQVIKCSDRFNWWRSIVHIRAAKTMQVSL